MSPSVPACRSPLLTALLAAALGVCMFVAGSGCSRGPGTPQGVVTALQSAAESKDYGAVWDLLSAATQAQVDIALDRLVKSLKSDADAQAVFGTNVEGAIGMNARQRFVSLLHAGQTEPRIGEDAALLKDVEVLNAPRTTSNYSDGDVVTLRLRANGQERDLHVIRESGSWRIDGTAGGACGMAYGRGDLTWLLLLPLALWVLRRRASTGP